MIKVTEYDCILDKNHLTHYTGLQLQHTLCTVQTDILKSIILQQPLHCMTPCQTIQTGNPHHLEKAVPIKKRESSFQINQSSFKDICKYILIVENKCIGEGKMLNETYASS